LFLFFFSKGLAPSGNLVTNAAVVIPYTVSLGNVPGRNMQAFAGTNVTMRGIDGKFYPDFQTFFDYYGKIEYADIYIRAALDGVATNFAAGNADFTGKAFSGRNRKKFLICRQDFQSSSLPTYSNI
jgi:hypothetical protein